MQVFDGTRGWVQAIRAAYTKCPSGRSAIRSRAAARHSRPCCWRRSTARFVPARLPDVKDDAGRSITRSNSGRRLEPMVLYVDPDNGADDEADVRRRRRRASRSSRRVFSDYRASTASRSPSGERQRGGAAGARAPRHRVEDQRSARPRAVQASSFLSPRLLLSCGEPSGDLYAGALTRELRRSGPDIEVAGLGGPAFARAGGGCSSTTAAWRSPASPKSSPRSRSLRGAEAAARRLRRATGPTRWSSSTSPDFNVRLARGCTARHPGRLLHQPADLGVAAGR